MNALETYWRNQFKKSVHTVHYKLCFIIKSGVLPLSIVVPCTVHIVHYTDTTTNHKREICNCIIYARDVSTVEYAQHILV